jgi:hypothetical protein
VEVLTTGTPQIVTIFGDKAFRKIMEVKGGYKE